MFNFQYSQIALNHKIHGLAFFWSLPIFLNRKPYQTLIKCTYILPNNKRRRKLLLNHAFGSRNCAYQLQFKLIDGGTRNQFQKVWSILRLFGYKQRLSILLECIQCPLGHLSVCGLNRRKIFYVFVTKLFSWVFRRVFLFSIRFKWFDVTTVTKWLQAGFFYFWQYLTKSIMTKVLFWHRSQRFLFRQNDCELNIEPNSRTEHSMFVCKIYNFNLFTQIDLSRYDYDVERKKRNVWNT